MKAIIGVIISLCILITTGTSAFAVNGSEGVEIQTSGVTMSAEDFKNVFSGNPNDRIDIANARSIAISSISIKNISIQDDEIKCIVNLIVGNKEEKIPVEGKLRSSYKSDKGKNSIIIEVDSMINGYNFLLFELYNDYGDNNLLVSTEKTLGNPHVKVYMQDEFENIYLFETTMPEEFSTLDATKYPRANKEKDAFWAINLVEGEEKELLTNNDILEELGVDIKAKGLNSWTTWVNPTTYYYSFYVGSDYTQCWSLPYVEYKHVNVRSQDSTWTASFKIAEHMAVAGNKYYGNNVFNYKNLQIAFACGDKTTFVRTLQEGRVNRGNTNPGSKITVLLLNKAVGKLPYGTTLQTALECIKTITSTSGHVILGNMGVNLSNRKTVAVGEKLNNYTLEKCTDYNGSINNGDYFTYQGVLQYEAASGNTNTLGVLYVSFDKFFTGDYSLTNITKNFQLNYSSQP